MAENSKIEWTDHTFNPWIGCAKVHAGCTHCYAETLMDSRYGRVKWGPNGTRQRTSETNWRKPLAWNRAAEKAGVPAKVFCASLADVFEDRDDLSRDRADLFALIDATPHLIWLMLTKRPENVRRMWPHNFTPMGPSEYRAALDGDYNVDHRPNVWLGTSPCNQETADKAIPELLKCRDLCGGLFLSCEPLLGSLNLKLDSILFGNRGGRGNIDGQVVDFPGIDWVIVGGESGHGARPMHPAWVRGLRDQCQAAGVPFFFKQHGEWGAGAEKLATGEPVFREFTSFDHWVGKAPTWANGGTCIDTAGNILTRGYHFMAARDENRFPVAVVHRLGKAKAGRHIDGHEWSEFPASFGAAVVTD